MEEQINQINNQQETSGVTDVGQRQVNKVPDNPQLSESQRVSPVDACIKCSNHKVIYCKGYCKSCYNLVHRNKEKYNIYMKKWKANNPNYFNEYYHKNKEIKND